MEVHMGELGHPSRREDSPSTSGRSHSRHADQQQHIVPANLKKKDEQLVSNLRSRAPEGLDELNMDGVAYNLICKLKEVSRYASTFSEMYNRAQAELQRQAEEIKAIKKEREENSMQPGPNQTPPPAPAPLPPPLAQHFGGAPSEPVPFPLSGANAAAAAGLPPADAVATPASLGMAGAAQGGEPMVTTPAADEATKMEMLFKAAKGWKRLCEAARDESTTLRKRVEELEAVNRALIDECERLRIVGMAPQQVHPAIPTLPLSFEGPYHPLGMGVGAALVNTLNTGGRGMSKVRLDFEHHSLHHSL